ncbi:MAG: response regulator [Lachnospiraceae bacterium]|nr:response regulator [Lachnospiraceae bacterium]
MIAQDDSKNTGALAGFYAAVYKVFLRSDTYERLKGRSQKINNLENKEGQGAQDFFYRALEITTNGDNLDKLREFVDFSTLDDRLNGVGSVTMEYKNTVNKWCRERFIAGERDVSGRLISVIWVVEDIDTERRDREELMQYSREVEQAWEDAEEARYQAENANKAKSIFLANMSHEIRTPINAVLGLDTMILRESREEHIRKYALNIQNAGQGLLSIINDILDLSKIESGKMEIVPVEYDIASLINDVSNMILPKADAKGLEFNMTIDPSTPEMLFGDDVRIRQVLVNLLTNAVKYTKEGSVTLTVICNRIDNEAELVCSVKDTGIGIAKEDLDKLYEEFVRIEEKRNRNIEGTGLGINIVTNLLKLMGSKLEVDSTYGEGSEFRFAIRQGIIKDEPVGDLEKLLHERTVEYNYETGFVIPDTDILVVDDNEMNRYVFKSLLKELECRIDEAESGKKCLELAGEKKYDIIFMDHMMPEMDGIETFHRLREMKDSPNAGTPVIVLTANAITGAREQYLQEGFDDFLTKPIVAEKLEKLIGDLIPDDKKRASSVRNALRVMNRDEEQEELPDVEGVDWKYALLKVRKTDALKEIVRDFRKTADTEIDILSDMFEKVLSDEGNTAYNDYRVRVHAMKSSSALCGALQVSSLAKVLEIAARDGDKETIVAVMPVFTREWRRLKSLLDETFGNADDNASDDPDGADAVIDKVMFEGYLDRLEQAMEELDTDVADAVMEELAGYSFDEGTKKLLAQLSSAVTSLDTEAAADLIRRLKDALE